VRDLKRYVPDSLRPLARRIYRGLLGSTADSREGRLARELEVYSACDNVHDLPPIAHYWSNRYLVPMIQTVGFSSAGVMFRHYIRKSIQSSPQPCNLLSIGSGSGKAEIEIVRSLLNDGLRNFHFECLDINPSVLKSGIQQSGELGIDKWISFREFNVNSWNPQHPYGVVMAIQCLHHFIELEALFGKIRRVLQPGGYFVVDDMIGRNGHRRWPEALRIVRQLWRELPDKYKYNRGTGIVERQFENADASTVGFEGVRAQDILPLLLMHFRFEVFLGFANLIDPFIDRSFGPNFDADSSWDRGFIDRVHALDMKHMEEGTLKPAHMYAVMSLNQECSPRVYKNLTPAACVRWPLSRLHWRALAALHRDTVKGI
jgi:ubiquinone/menaquinone biosynthesis C-methylase UbiE